MSDIVNTAKTIGELVKKGVTIDLQEKIMELREQALELQEENHHLRTENLALKKQAESRERVTFKRRVYWLEGDDVPCCPYCHDKTQSLIHMTERKDAESGGSIYRCPECGVEYYAKGQDDFHIYWTPPKR